MGGTALTPFSENYVYQLVNGEKGPDPVLQYDIECKSELLNVIHWIGWKVVDEKAKSKRIDDLEENIENKIDSFFSIKRPYDVDISVDQAKKVKLRHVKTDRLYTMNRIVGGVMGEIWKLNKGGIQSKKRLKEGKKLLTPKQHQQAFRFYEIALAIRNFEQLKEDIPAALNQINKGGLFIANVNLIPYVSKIMKMVVDSYRFWSMSPFPGKAIKETVKQVRADEELKTQFHAIVREIPEIEESGFTREHLEEFRSIFQRKLMHAKIADLIRGGTRRRNEKRGKRGVGGQNLRCMLYGMAKKSKLRTVVAKPKTNLKKANAKKVNAKKTNVKKANAKKVNAKKTNVKKANVMKANVKISPTKPSKASDCCTSMVSPTKPSTSGAASQIKSRSGRNIKKIQSIDFCYNLS